MTQPLDLTLEHWIALFRGPLTGLLASFGADALLGLRAVWLAHGRSTPLVGAPP